jgi:hypothetical protein
MKVFKLFVIKQYALKVAQHVCFFRKVILTQKLQLLVSKKSSFLRVTINVLGRKKLRYLSPHLGCRKLRGPCVTRPIRCREERVGFN